MKRETSRLTGAVFLAIAVHVLFLGVLVVSFNWTPTPSLPSSPQVIKAVTVTADQADREMERLKQAKRQEQERKQAQLKAAQEQAAKQQRQLQAIKQQRAAAALAEQKRKDDEAKRRAEEKHRQDEAARAAAQRQAEAKRAAEQKRKEEEAKRLAEQERKEEEARRLAEQKRKQEEAKRLAEEAQRRRDEQALQQQLAAEQAQRDQSVVSQYVGLIKQKVTRNWVRPTGWQPGQTCQVDIQLMPGGDVVNVSMVTSCGSTLFDQSVQTAVMRAAPLPLPPNGVLFDRFRDITFIFNPKDNDVAP